MTEIYCENNDCINNSNIGRCGATAVCLDMEFSKCSEYTPYLTTNEYQNEYLIAVRDKSVAGGACSMRRTGKKITISGEDFYTIDHPNNPPYLIQLTHGRTGYRVGDLDLVTRNIDRILEEAKKYPDVTTLPEKECETYE